MELTIDAFFDGRLHLWQPRKGFRAGIDSVLLAAAMPVRAGERVFEAGSGPGVAALCLLARVAQVHITGVEINPDYATLARANAARNHLGERLHIIEGNALRAGKADGPGQPGELRPGTFDHAFANPPFHAASATRPSPDAGKAAAHVADAPLIEWVRTLTRMVRPKGTVSLILPATALPDLLSAMQAAHVGGIAIAPLWPRAGQAANRVIVQGRRGVKTPARLLPGLVLHESGNAFTEETERILRHRAPFPWAANGDTAT